MNEIVKPDDLVVDDPYAPLFETAADEVARLFGEIKLLAMLKGNDRPRYEELLQLLGRRKVPRLRELDQEVDRALKRAEKNRAERQAQQVTSDGFERDQHGKVLPTQENIRTAIDKLGVMLRYDSFAGIPVIEGLHGFGPAIDDNAMNRLWLTIDQSFGFRPVLQFFQIVVADACQQNPFHPVRDYLDGLIWDETVRLDNWLVTYCGVEDTAYARAVGRLMLIAAVRRVRQPGAKHDEMLVLEGPEGLSKSTMLEALAVNEDWFSDSLPLNVDDKKMIEAAAGKWIIEVSELQGMRKGDVGKIKAQLSRKRDRARLAYGRLPVEVARQCVFFGTVNPMEAEGYLASITGNRRFWPVEVTQIDIDAFRRDRDQLWAEAAMCEARGDSTRLDPSLWSAAGEQQAAREAPNPIRDKLAAHLHNRRGILFNEDVWTLLDIPVTQRPAFYGKLGKAMQDLGWMRKKRRRRPGAEQEWAYVRGSEWYRIEVRRSKGEMTISNVVANAPDVTEEPEEDTDLSHVVLPDLPDDFMG